MAEVDLEALAAGYDHRRTSSAALARAAEAARAAGLGPGTVAVDVGGGRGAHAGVFAASGASALVIDRSRAMAAAAATVPGVCAVVGDALRLPLRTGVADLVYFHLSLHYGDWRAMLDEAARAGRPGGVVWVWTFAASHAAGSFLARWFPTVAQIDGRRFPDPAAVAADLGSRACTGVAVGERTERVERPAGEWRAAVEGGFVSTLQLLEPAEVREGLQRFDRAHPDPLETVAYDLPYVSVSARWPSLP